MQHPVLQRIAMLPTKRSPHFLNRLTSHQLLHQSSVPQRRLLSKSASSKATITPTTVKSLQKDGESSFSEVQKTRPPFSHGAPIVVTESPIPGWKYGQSNPTPSEEPQYVEIDPNDPSRTKAQNYQLLIAGVPRPISFISTIDKEGRRNLAPFSYFQLVHHDPPTFVVGFGTRSTGSKDTLTNLRDTGECVINLVSEHMIEAVNATSLDTPKGQSEWELSGFSPAPSTTVKPQRVKDAIFAVEGKLLQVVELENRRGAGGNPGKPAAGLAIVEGTRFWVRQDALNSSKDDIDLEVLRPVVQLGGIAYGRVREIFELPRHSFEAELAQCDTGLCRLVDR